MEGSYPVLLKSSVFVAQCIPRDPSVLLGWADLSPGRPTLRQAGVDVVRDVAGWLAVPEGYQAPRPFEYRLIRREITEVEYRRASSKWNELSWYDAMSGAETSEPR